MIQPPTLVNEDGSCADLRPDRAELSGQRLGQSVPGAGALQDHLRHR